MKARVYPVGRPEQAKVGQVVVLSRNQKSIAVSFDDLPTFLSFHKGAFLSCYGVMLLAVRVPSGEWEDVNDRGRYTIDLQYHEN